MGGIGRGEGADRLEEAVGAEGISTLSRRFGSGRLGRGEGGAQWAEQRGLFGGKPSCGLPSSSVRRRFLVRFFCSSRTRCRLGKMDVPSLQRGGPKVGGSEGRERKRDDLELLRARKRFGWRERRVWRLRAFSESRYLRSQGGGGGGGGDRSSRESRSGGEGQLESK